MIVRISFFITEARPRLAPVIKCRRFVFSTLQRRDCSDENATAATKTKVLHALRVLFLTPCISFKFSANLRREMTISQVLQRT